MTKKILFIIESSETGGAESIFADLVAGIDRNLYFPHVVLLKNGWLSDHLKSLGVPFNIMPTSTCGFDLKLIHGLWNFISEEKVNLIHSHLFTSNVYSSFIGGLRGIPVVSTFHGTMDVSSSDHFKNVKWWIINRFSKKIVFVSNYLMKYFVEIKFANETKSTVVYNGINIGRFQNTKSKEHVREELGLPVDAFIVGCVGDLRPAKDYRSALQAIGILKIKIPEIKLVVAGTKTSILDDLMTFAKSLEVDKNVEFIGYRSDIQNVLSAYDVYLSSSTSEGFSLTVIEAMAAGLPVVATKSGGPEEIIQNSKTGFLANVGDPAEIAKHIEFLYYREELRLNIGIEAIQSIQNKFSTKNMVNNYQKLYQNYLGSI